MSDSIMSRWLAVAGAAALFMVAAPVQADGWFGSSGPASMTYQPTGGQVYYPPFQASRPQWGGQPVYSAVGGYPVTTVVPNYTAVIYSSVPPAIPGTPAVATVAVTPLHMVH